MPESDWRDEVTTVYHFCAMAQASPGALQYCDGTITTNKDVSDAAQYLDVKHAIREQMTPKLPEGADVVLLSLNVVGHK